MEVAPRTSCYWWFLFVFGIAIVRIRGDEIRNGTLQTSPNNATNYLTRPMEFDHKDTAGKRNKTYNNIVVTNKGKNNGRGGGWGWGGGSGSGGGGGGGGIGGGGGWGWGGGGGGWWGWGCRRQTKYNNSGRSGKKRYHRKDLEYKMGEYAQCMGRGRCRWMRLDCPLHCGGPCFYDCKHMCKAHCRR